MKYFSYEKFVNMSALEDVCRRTANNRLAILSKPQLCARFQVDSFRIAAYFVVTEKRHTRTHNKPARAGKSEWDEREGDPFINVRLPRYNRVGIYNKYISRLQSQSEP